ncbi:MAG: sulfatase-like hydrolase/transferase [Acidobacteriota bacterium]
MKAHRPPRTLLIAAALALLAGAVRPGRAEGRRANLLLITVDTLRADRLSCYDPAHVATPAMDGLAASGLIFDRAFSHVPLTLPAHASLLLGMTPPAHGVRDNGRFVAAEGSLTLAELLKSHGYATAAFVGGYPLHSRFGLAQGFEVYDDRFAAAPGLGREFAEAPAGAVADKALAWLEGRREPWFLWAHFYDPHDPYDPPEPYRSRFKDAPYDGEVAYVDATIGRLLARLRDLGLQGRTVIVLTGDHGESLGDHGELTHGFLACNSTLWVPLVIAAPAVRPGRTGEVVSHIDVFPTVCDLLAIPKPAGLEGRSLAPALAGRKLAPAPVYFECLSPYYGRGWAPLRGFLDGRMKFVDSPVPELYDLRGDFGEARNLAAGRDLSAYRKALARLAREDMPVGGSGTGAKLDAAAVERLRSLGYAAGPAAPKKAAFGPADDVKALLPHHTKAMRALVLSRDGRAGEAVRMLQEVIAARPDLDVARVNLALVYEAAGRTGEARQVLMESLRALPESYDVFAHAASFLIAAGEFREAASLIESRSLPQMESDPKIWVDLGLCCRNLKDYAKARTAYEAALAVDPTYPVVYNNLGTLELALLEEGRDPGAAGKAAAHFEKAIALDPGYAAAYYGLGQARYRAGRLDEAIAAMTAAAALDPGLLDAKFYLGLALYRQKRFAEALGPLVAYREKAGSDLDAADLRKLDGIIAECRARK